MARGNHFSRVWAYAGTAAGIMLLILACATPDAAQVASGSIVGTVRDASSAVVADAAVTVRNTETGIAREVRTNREGNYVVTLLQPGTYRVTVEREGFKKAFQPAFTLDVNPTTR